MANVTFTKNGGLGATQAIGNTLKKPGALPVTGPSPNLSLAVRQNVLANKASAGRIRAPNGVGTVNGGVSKYGVPGAHWMDPGSSVRNNNVEPFGAQGQFWGMFGPDGPNGQSQARVNALIAQNAARATGGTTTTTTSGSQGGGPTGFTGGMSMGGNSQLPGMGGGGFGGMQSMGGFGGQYMGQLGDMLAGGMQQPPPEAPAPPPKPEPGTGPGWVDPRDPLTFTGGGYPADDTTHGNALIQQMLASNPRMPQRGDPSGKPGPKPPTAPPKKPGGGKWPGWGGHGGGHHGGPWWR